jgi:hypothetical protein
MAVQLSGARFQVSGFGNDTYLGGLEPSQQQYQGRHPGSPSSGYRCHHYNVLTAFPPFFLFFDPVQSVFAHWTSRNIKPTKQGNADSFESH